MTVARRRVEILTFEGCPHAGGARELVERVMSDLDLEAEFHSIRIEDAGAAERLGFLGSPSIRVDGRDVEPGAADRADYTFSCRVYRTPHGLRSIPDEAWVRAALQPTGMAAGTASA